MKGNPVLRRSSTIVMLGGLLAGGLAALPAQARTTTAATAAHTGQQQIARSGPVGVQPMPRQVAVHQAVALALARQRWLHGHLNAQTAAAAAATGVAAARFRAVHQRASMLTGVVRAPGGLPLPGACLTATCPAGPSLARCRADRPDV